MSALFKYTSVALLLALTNIYELGLVVRARNEVNTTGAQLFNENVQRNRAFKCGPPQPRVVTWESILDNQEKLDECEVIYPHVTVLHKCAFEAGCCPAQKECMMDRSEEVTVVFKITRIKRFGYVCNETHQEPTRFVYAQALNHTVCSCQSGKNYPK